MKIFLGADHRGFELKEKIKTWLLEWGFEHTDCGAFLYDKDDDYVDFISAVAKKVSEDSENNKGIVLGMTGQGEAMVANKFKGIRASVFYGPDLSFETKRLNWWLLALSKGGGLAEKILNNKFKKIIQLSREHNDANILSLGAGFVEEHSIKFLVKLWLDTKFAGEERHVRRINKIKQIENG